jgi:hypothetical protein
MPLCNDILNSLTPTVAGIRTLLFHSVIEGSTLAVAGIWPLMSYSVISTSAQEVTLTSEAITVMSEYPLILVFCWILLESHSCALAEIVPSHWNGSALDQKKQQFGSFMVRLEVNNTDCSGWV